MDIQKFNKSYSRQRYKKVFENLGFKRAIPDEPYLYTIPQLDVKFQLVYQMKKGHFYPVKIIWGDYEVSEIDNKLKSIMNDSTSIIKICCNIGKAFKGIGDEKVEISNYSKQKIDDLCKEIKILKKDEYLKLLLNCCYFCADFNTCFQSIKRKLPIEDFCSYFQLKSKINEKDKEFIKDIKNIYDKPESRIRKNALTKKTVRKLSKIGKKIRKNVEIRIGDKLWEIGKTEIKIGESIYYYTFEELKKKKLYPQNIQINEIPERDLKQFGYTLGIDNTQNILLFLVENAIIQDFIEGKLIINFQEDIIKRITSIRNHEPALHHGIKKIVEKSLENYELFYDYIIYNNLLKGDIDNFSTLWHITPKDKKIEFSDSMSVENLHDFNIQLNTILNTINCEIERKGQSIVEDVLFISTIVDNTHLVFLTFSKSGVFIRGIINSCLPEEIDPFKEKHFPRIIRKIGKEIKSDRMELFMAPKFEEIYRDIKIRNDASKEKEINEFNINFINWLREIDPSFKVAKDEKSVYIAEAPFKMVITLSQTLAAWNNFKICIRVGCDDKKERRELTEKIQNKIKDVYGDVRVHEASN